MSQTISRFLLRWSARIVSAEVGWQVQLLLNAEDQNPIPRLSALDSIFQSALKTAGKDGNFPEHMFFLGDTFVEVL